ncbi:MAG TPA: hypothetical protein DEQ38_02450 [Elusimicrobia bacterium]|nr:MAG: hypothetical protein A2089_10750 [Elusimicrobia bacterium GWD2_63_28]HCC46970.1 hypothetical protein [Elusimicrobiota bacterium]
MKIKILLAVLLAGVCAVAAPAAETKNAGKTPAFSEAREQVDAVSKEILEVEALYWAWRVKYLGDVSYDELREKSRRWIGKPGTKAQLFARMKEILDGGSARALTAAEMRKYDEGKEKIRDLLAPGRKDLKLAAQLSLDYCMDLDARYWARRVQQGEKEILQLRRKWAIRPEIKQRYFSLMDEKLGQENAPLSKEEIYKMEACSNNLHR